jgi:FAD dependent oxidoreductase TIGR03364
LKGVLYSPTELVVDPRQAIARLPIYLHEKYHVEFHFNTAIVHVEEGRMSTAANHTIRASTIVIASGADFQSLFPEMHAKLGLKRCKLQMLRTVPQPNGWALGPHLAGGLTLTHYKSFEVCPSLAKLKERIRNEMPEYVKNGIHVMASQNELGEVVIGDSHEYDADISIFDNPNIDDLILKYLRRMVELPDPQIAARWHGIYAKHPERAIVIESPARNVTYCASPGGAGMTLSFGIARQWWDRQ